MAEILFIIVSAVSIVFAVYGIWVFCRWDKAAKKANRVLDDMIWAELEKEMEAEPCALCGSKWIDIEVRTVSPDDMYVFSTNKAIGLMYCPLCGRKLEGGEG